MNDTESIKDKIIEIIMQIEDEAKLNYLYTFIKEKLAT